MKILKKYFAVLLLTSFIACDTSRELKPYTGDNFVGFEDENIDLFENDSEPLQLPITMAFAQNTNTDITVVVEDALNTGTTEGIDYSVASYVVTIPAGAYETFFELEPLNDQVEQGFKRQLSVKLSSSTQNVALGHVDGSQQSVTVNLIDDDCEFILQDSYRIKISRADGGQFSNYTDATGNTFEDPLDEILDVVTLTDNNDGTYSISNVFANLIEYYTGSENNRALDISASFQRNSNNELYVIPATQYGSIDVSGDGVLIPCENRLSFDMSIWDIDFEITLEGI
ncbi:hypothetical protein [Sediminitomix flava]|uniref:Uncharacterized protein n=1 Tax=Sediminitomix flava TaxID=379075 RepID=A0A315ZDF0_SEDFL|nr:hypothetical protein [Sediminitomix flava]PWJ42744.1 hypothetical protein BC781_102289 [Sediminitomix flava]